MELEILVMDFANNPRQKLFERYCNGEISQIGLVKSIARERGITRDFKNYLVIPANGQETLYIPGGHAECIISPPTDRLLLEKKVEEAISSKFYNPRKVILDRRVPGIKVSGTIYTHDSGIYPNNTLLVIDQRFEEAALRAISGYDIDPVMHYDDMQLSLF